jgi:hypothetical protein
MGISHRSLANYTAPFSHYSQAKPVVLESKDNRASICKLRGLWNKSSNSVRCMGEDFVYAAGVRNQSTVHLAWAVILD